MTSAADHLLSAESVVLAREDPDRPFHFSPTEVLKGDPGDEPIELFLDSGTRRTLSKDTEKTVVLAMTTAEDGVVHWQRIGLADEAFEPIVRHTLASEEVWMASPELRVDYFDEWLGNPDPQLRNLAHLEIARAPYSRILECRDVLSREEIHEFLGNVRYIDWHHLYILLLAAKGNPEDHQKIRQAFYSNARLGMAKTQEAWAAAYIEIAGDEAIAAIEEHYFRHSNRSPEELTNVLQALSVHGTSGHVYLRDRILTSYALLLNQYPERAVDLIKDLQAWKRSELTAEIAAIASEPPSEIDTNGLRQLRDYTLLQMRSGLRPARAPMRP